MSITEGAVSDVFHVGLGVNGGLETTLLSKVLLVTRQNKLNYLLEVMNKIAVTGVTIKNVLNCGVQKCAINTNDVLK